MLVLCHTSARLITTPRMHPVGNRIFCFGAETIEGGMGLGSGPSVFFRPIDFYHLIRSPIKFEQSSSALLWRNPLICSINFPSAKVTWFFSLRPTSQWLVSTARCSHFRRICRLKKFIERCFPLPPLSQIRCPSFLSGF